MSTRVKSFVGNHLPDFISSQHPQFKLFLEAYYEWLEKQNTTQSTSALDLFKELQNPAGLVANAKSHNDIDDTLDGFLQYFQKEVLPVSVEAAAATQRFTIKKIRDLYLSKGTPKSFRLLFRLLYDQEIEIYEPSRSVLETSEGKYLSFPNVTMEAVGNHEVINEMDLQLSYISDSEGGERVIATVLSGRIIGVEDSEKNEIISAQLNNFIDLDINTTYFLFDPTDESKYLRIKPLPTISSITINKKGTLYTENDKISFTSKRFGKNYNAEVDSISFSPITHVVIRNRGSFYNVGDMFSFYSDNVYDGKGGYFIVTGIDKAGKITEIDGTPVRSGILNNGFESSTFEEVKVPISNGGKWKIIPKIKYVPNRSDSIGTPYNNGENGYGLQATPYSNDLGQINNIIFRDIPFFSDSDDVAINIPFNILLENNSSIEKGNVVSLQTFNPSSNSFKDDSETITIGIVSKRNIEDNWMKFHREYTNLLIDFDSELFQWNIKKYQVDSDLGLDYVVSNFDSDKVLTTQIIYKKDRLYYGGNSFSQIDSDGVADLNGPTQFSTIGPATDLGTYENIPSQRLSIIYKNNGFINKLDKTHFDAIDSYNPIYVDSEFELAVTRKTAEPNTTISLDSGTWVDRGYYGKVVEVSDNVIKVIPAAGLNPFTEEGLKQTGEEKYGVMRLSPFSISGKVEKNVGLEITNVVVEYSTFGFTYTIASVAETSKQFINEDGFLNSTSGGIVNDNYVYSSHTYIVKSKISMDEWRGRVKTLLHPSGKYLFGETVLDQNIAVSRSISSTATSDFIRSSAFDFSQAQDYFESGAKLNQITADSIQYKANPFEWLIIDPNGKSLTADNFTNLSGFSDKTQYGNSFWDYEPVGSARKEIVDVVANLGTLENLDDYYTSVTSQDSDGAGYIKNEVTRWKPFEVSPQDFYKTSSRRERGFNSPVVKSTAFADSVSERYEAYDSELPRHVFMRFSDSDAEFTSIEYSKLRTDGNTSRNLPTDVILRQKELSEKRLKDFGEAMKENNSFFYVEGDNTYYDFEAYERKWNTINDNRTINNEGWMIPGWHSMIQNTSTRISRKRRIDEYNFATPLYAKTKTPLNNLVWQSSGPDYWVWNPTYNLEINNIRYFNYDDVSQDEAEKLVYEPYELMKHRRVK